jgi:hypothetical protein
MQTSGFMQETEPAPAGPEECLLAMQSLAGCIDDFARRALSVQDVSLSVAQYVSGQDMGGYDEAVSIMEAKVRALSQEASARGGSLRRIAGHLKETKGSLLTYASYIRTISKVCRKLSLGQENAAAGQCEARSFLDLAAAHIYSIDQSIAHITQVLDKLLALMEMQASGTAEKVEGLDAALDHALKQTRKNRKELSSRLKDSLGSIRDFHGGWSELTAWVISLRRALRSSREPAGGETASPGKESTPQAPSRACFSEGVKTGVPEQPRGFHHDGDAGLSLHMLQKAKAIPAEPESLLRPVSGADAFLLARLARLVGQFCAGMRGQAGCPFPMGHSTAQAMKKALRDLSVLVEHCLAMEGELIKALKAATEVAATIFKALLEIENTALKTELLVLNGCIHSGNPRGYSVLAGSIRRLSAITSSHIRFVGDGLGKVAEEMDPQSAGTKRLWRKIHFAPAFAGFQELDRDAWCLMEAVLSEAEALCADMSACIEGAGTPRAGTPDRMNGNMPVKGSSQ